MNSVQHFDIPTKNVARAKKFYKDVFGWKYQDIPGMNYTMCQTAPTDKNFMLKKPGSINGGMYKRKGTKDVLCLVINVPDLNKHITKAKKAGAKVYMKPVQVGEMGFYAQIKDSEGNVLGLWQEMKKTSKAKKKATKKKAAKNATKKKTTKKRK